MKREDVARMVEELKKLSPEEREARRLEREKKADADHRAKLAEAQIAFEAAESELGVGRVKLLDHVFCPIVLQVPSRNDRRLFRNVIRNEKVNEGGRREAEEKLVRDCLLWPELGTYEAAVELFPKLAEAAALSAVTMGDAAEVDERGK